MDTTKALAKINPTEYGLDKKQASSIEAAFSPKIAEREVLKKVFALIIKKTITPELAEQAKAARLKLVKVRTGISEIHKTQKAYFRAAGLFVDAWKNKETLPVEQMEEKLFEVEDYYPKIERERMAELGRKRTEELSKYEADTENFDLINMSEDGFEQLSESLKLVYEKRIEDELAEEKAEKKRLAKVKAEEKRDKAEAERNKRQNEKLKLEAEKRDKVLEEEREKNRKLSEELKDREAEVKAEEEAAAEEKSFHEEHDKALAEEVSAQRPPIDD